MMIRLSRPLAANPIASLGSFGIRNYRGSEDIAHWLRIRERALVGQIAAGRSWTERDFHREFLEKSWWRPDWMWFAEKETSFDNSIALGAIALRTVENEPLTASIQWLLVVPEHRRRGAGRQLLATLEAAAWEAGCRTVIAETLREWAPAIRFYESLGYAAKP